MKLRALLMLLLPLLVPVITHAGPATPSFSSEPGFMLTPPEEEAEKLRLESSFSYIGKADFSNNLGSVEVARMSIAADYSIFRLTYENSRFFWLHTAQVARSLGASRRSTTTAPWDSLNDLTLQGRLLNSTYDRDWHYWLNGTVTSSFEEDFPGALGIGLDGGVAYDIWGGWLVGLSGRSTVLSALNKDLFSEMELGIALATSQRVLRSTLQALGFRKEAEEGSDNIGFSVALSGASKTYRLASHSPIERNGYLSMIRAKIGAYVDYQYDENLFFSAGPEFHYNRKYQIYNSSGSFRSSHDLDNALGGYVRMLYRF